MGRRSRKRGAAPVAPRAGATHDASAPAASAAPRASTVRDASAPARTSAAPGARSARASAGARRSRRDEAPAAPWGSFPLVELCALAAIVLGAWGILRGGRGGAVLLVAAMLLGSVAGLEVAIREHLGGYRSHTLVLSGVATIATLAVLFFAQVERAALLLVAVAVFPLAFVAWRTIFKRRSGGAGFRVR
jgi:hypothetical protein